MNWVRKSMLMYISAYATEETCPKVHRVPEFRSPMMDICRIFRWDSVRPSLESEEEELTSVVEGAPTPSKLIFEGSNRVTNPMAAHINVRQTLFSTLPRPCCC